MSKHFSSLSRLAVLVAGLAVLPMSASAIAFDNTTPSGVATVGAGGDYATLYDASIAFNALTAPFLQGNWRMEVIGDLTEATNVAFGNTIPAGSSLTLKPAVSLTPTITFTATVDNAGPSGNFFIGNTSLTVATPVKTDNFIIDGSNTPGGTTRDLTIQNTTGALFAFARLMVLYGDSDNVVFKNTKFLNFANGASNIEVIYITANSTGSVVPDNFVINNNLIQAQSVGANRASYGIEISHPTATVVPSAGWVISNNDIDVRMRGIYLNGSINGSITGNSIQVVGANSGFLAYGIYGGDGRNANNQTLNILKNKLHVSTTNTFNGNFGAVGLFLASSVGTGCVCNIINNMVHIESVAASVTNQIRLSGTDLYNPITYTLHHNSFYISASGTIVTQGSGGTTGVNGIGSHRSTSPLVDLQNNIVRVTVAGGAALYRAALTGTYSTNNNILFAATNTAYVVTTPYTTLANWQASAGSPDAGSAAVDPLATTGSKWVPSGVADLHFIPASSKPVELVGMPLIASVPTDIDGDTRNTLGTALVYPGADEGLVPVPVTMSGFSIE